MGCEILIARNDCPGHPGPMRGDRGDPVVVRPSGWRWGREEVFEAGNAFIIEIPDVEAPRLQVYLEGMDPDDVGEPRFIRAYNVRLGELPQGIQSILETQGYVTIPYQDVRERIRHRRTGDPLPQNLPPGGLGTIGPGG